MTTKRKHEAYTLWQNWRNTGWEPSFTIKEESGLFSPIHIIERYMERYDLEFWVRGKTWMIKPEGQTPAKYLNQ